LRKGREKKDNYVQQRKKIKKREQDHYEEKKIHKG